MADKDEEVVLTPELTPESTPELTPEDQQVEDALLQVNGDVKGELRPNPTMDEPVVDEEEPETPVETPEEVEEPEKPEEVIEPEEQEEAPVAPELTPEKDETGVYAPVTAQDPGQFKQGDYSFTIQTADGKTRRISTVEDAETLAGELDNNPELISASQFLMLGRKTASMEQGIAAEERTYQAQKEQFDQQTEQAQSREQYLTQWQGEVNYLRGKGELPALEASLNNADWTDPKVANEPGIKETVELLKWMQVENDRRMEAGLPADLSVVSAYNARQLELIRSEDRETTSREKTLTRSRGAMVGKKAPAAPSSGAARGTITGTPHSLDDLATEAYYAAQE